MKKIKTELGFYILNEKTYSQYSWAMGRKRPESILEENRFWTYANSSQVFENNGSYLIGQEENGIFSVTHFAPTGLKGGVELIKKAKSFSNVAFAVTEDLAPMLKKLGYKKVSKNLSSFRENLVEKTIFVSSYKVVFHILLQKIQEITFKVQIRLPKKGIKIEEKFLYED